MDQKTMLLLAHAIKLNSLKFKALELALKESSPELYTKYCSHFAYLKLESIDELNTLQSILDEITQS